MKKITMKEIESITDTEKEIGTTRFLPNYVDVPIKFKEGRSKWNSLFSHVMFSGVKNLHITPKEGIDPEKAWGFIVAHIKSWRPKHEHKEAGCAYLMSQIFDDAEWDQRSKDGAA